MDYFSDNLYQIIKKKEINSFLIKIYSYQILRGLNYLAMLSIAHRDIKPQNILVDRYKHNVIISDFGSAKQLVKCIFHPLFSLSQSSIYMFEMLPCTLADIRCDKLHPSN